jgi:hypothetical protein
VWDISNQYATYWSNNFVDKANDSIPKRITYYTSRKNYVKTGDYWFYSSNGEKKYNYAPFTHYTYLSGITKVYYYSSVVASFSATDDSSSTGSSSTGSSSTPESTDGGEFVAPDLDNPKNRAVFTAESADKKWQVPTGVYEVDVHLQSGSGIVSEFKLNREVHKLEFPKVVEFKFNGDQVAAYLGSNINDESPTFLASVDKESYDSDGVTVQISNLNNKETSEQHVRRLLSFDPSAWCDWWNSCPIGYTNLHSDFTPVLEATTSGLKLFGGVPSLKVDFSLPNYYYNVIVSYSQCTASPSLTATSGAIAACDTLYATEINYVDYCNFDLAEKTGDATAYSYSGELTIRAHLQLTVAGFQVERVVESPLNWVVFLDRQITVTTDITLENDDTCSNNSQCNNQGCCEPTVADPNVNYCNCECVQSGQLSGYAGDYCYEDVTPPTCTIPDAVGAPCPGCDGAVVTALEIEIESDHGGCKKYDFTAILPTFDDNSGFWYTSRMDQVNQPGPDAPTAQLPNDFESLTELNAFCFDIGVHSINWQVSDVAGVPPSGNEYALCGYIITVVDKSEPYVDCAQCNSDDLAANVCVGNELVEDVLQADLSDYFNDQFIEDEGAVTFAGDSLSCDCSEAQGEYQIEIDQYYQSFGSWGTIYSIDVYDDTDSVSTTSPQADDYDLDFADTELTYTATDDGTNQGSCSITVTVDTTPPTCEGINLGTVETALVAHEIHDTQINGNYTDSITFDLAGMNVDGSVSGIAPDGAPTLGDLKKDTAVTDFEGAGSPPTSGDTFYLNPSDPSTTYSAVITLTDNAGNEGSCSWTLTVTNPAPCVWPDCEDRPPQCHNPPTDQTFDCRENGDCGCGNWAEPLLLSDLPFDDPNNLQIFTDDRGIVESSYYFNKSPNDVLLLGANVITYGACDYHGGTDYQNPTDEDHCATCTFTITYTDNTAPTFPDCPDSNEYDTETDTYDFDYSVGAFDECVLNENISLVGGKTGEADIIIQELGSSVTYNTETEAGTLSLTVGSHGFLWTATDTNSNPNTCEFTITINDKYPPVIDCGYGDDESNNYYVRIDQGATSATVGFEASAEDSNDGTLTDDIVYELYDSDSHTYTEITNAYEFTAGYYIIMAYVEDANENPDQCEIEIEVAEPYPTVYFRPTLTKADIY